MFGCISTQNISFPEEEFLTSEKCIPPTISFLSIAIENTLPKMENTFPPMQWRKHIFHGDVKRYQNIYELILVVLDQNVKHIEFIPSHRRSFFYLVDTASDFLHHKFNFYQNERIIDFTTSSWDIEIATWEKICTNYHQLSSYCSCSENDLNFGISLILAYQSEIF